MRIQYIAALLVSLSFSQISFADLVIMQKNSPDCAAIAKACTDAGYVSGETTDKKIWQDCMRPTILGEKVDGVTVDVKTVKACRTDKIADTKYELKALQNAAAKK